MSSELALLVQGITATIQIAKGLKSSYDAHAVMQAQSNILEKLFSLQTAALALQEEHFALVNTNEALQKKLVEIEKWEKTESEYELKQLSLGVFVYALKQSDDPTKPKHWLCPRCWEERKKSILQRQYSATYECPQCKTQIVDHNEPPEPPIRMRVDSR